MKLDGKAAGTILWEIWGPVDGRNRWSDGVNAVLITPSVDIVFNAGAGAPPVAVELLTNVTPLNYTATDIGQITQPKHDRLNPVPGVTETATSPRPVSFGEGMRPDPSEWGGAGAAFAVVITAPVAGGLFTTNIPIPVELNGAPVWIRVRVSAIGTGDVKMVTKWS